MGYHGSFIRFIHSPNSLDSSFLHYRLRSRVNTHSTPLLSFLESVIDAPFNIYRIYLLNLFLAFIQPKFDPALAADLAEDEAEAAEPGLPTSQSQAEQQSGLQDGEFRPFIRRLPEFKFWYTHIFAFSLSIEREGANQKERVSRYSATRAITLSILSTFFGVFDIPVFWPILVFYFCILTFITLKRQVGHMRKYK